MKIVALTTTAPDLRYRVHLHALRSIGIDLRCVAISGFGLRMTRIPRSLRRIARLGPAAYLARRRRHRMASGERAAVADLLHTIFPHDVFMNEPAINRQFAGLSTNLLRFIDREKPALLFQFGVGLLPRWFIDRAPPILNVHPGILPGIRGTDPVFWAHYYGKEAWLGSTIHVIDAGIDTGPPLLRKRFRTEKHRHYAHSVVRQLRSEQDLLRSFVANVPNRLESIDDGGEASSIYRGLWSREDYQRLEAAGWWGAERLE